MSTIRTISATEILDSRKKPTLRVEVTTDAGSGSFDVPSGASTGSREACELRDAQGAMSSAVRAIHEEIAPALIGMDPQDQRAIDARMIELDGTEHKSRLGGNSLIGISIATARAAAQSNSVPLHEHLKTLATIPPSRATPHLFVNLINGGKHASGGSPIQEHQIVTLALDAHEALEHAMRTERALADILTEKHILPAHGDEGGVVFPVSTIEEPFAILAEAIDAAHLNDKVVIGVDAAASSFYENGSYALLGVPHSSDDLLGLYASLSKSFNVQFLEDPFEENSLVAFSELHHALPSLTIIGDDLTTTNPRSIKAAAEANAISAVIIKPNQIGTLSETLDAMAMARSQNVHCIVSHRSGETMDDFLGDLSVAFGVFGLKAGAPSAPERAIKYKRLLELLS